MTKVVASIEARMTSSRLPGKVLKDLAGVPLLTRMLRRLRQCLTLDAVVLATTTNSDDDCLEEWARAENILCHRGSEGDVLRRVVDAHEKFDTDIIVELTGDCPFVDPEVIDLGVETFLKNQCSVVTNVRSPSYPQGVDVQVFKLNDLSKVAKDIHDPAVREHVSLYFYERPEIYDIVHLIAPRSLQAPQVRLQCDYAEDLEFLNSLYLLLDERCGDTFSTHDVLAMLTERPELLEINRYCVEKPVR